MISERRLKRFRVSSTVIIQMGQKGFEGKVVEDALPDDAHIVDAAWDGENGYIDFIIHSESFPAIPECSQPTEMICPVLEYVK